MHIESATLMGPNGTIDVHYDNQLETCGGSWYPSPNVKKESSGESLEVFAVEYGCVPHVWAAELMRNVA